MNQAQRQGQGSPVRGSGRGDSRHGPVCLGWALLTPSCSARTHQQGLQPQSRRGPGFTLGVQRGSLLEKPCVWSAVRPASRRGHRLSRFAPGDDRNHRERPLGMAIAVWGRPSVLRPVTALLLQRPGSPHKGLQSPHAHRGWMPAPQVQRPQPTAGPGLRHRAVHAFPGFAHPSALKVSCVLWKPLGRLRTGFLFVYWPEGCLPSRQPDEKVA